MQCLITQAPHWVAITQHTAATLPQESGTRTMTPGNSQKGAWMLHMPIRAVSQDYHIVPKPCSSLTYYINLYTVLNMLSFFLVFRVSPMSSSQVRSSDAYVLFYELANSSRL